MKKLILLLFIPIVFACGGDDEDVPICVDETLINLETPCLLLLTLCVVVTVTHIIIVVRLLIGMARIAFEDGPCN